MWHRKVGLRQRTGNGQAAFFRYSGACARERASTVLGEASCFDGIHRGLICSREQAYRLTHCSQMVKYKSLARSVAWLPQEAVAFAVKSNWR